MTDTHLHNTHGSAHGELPEQHPENHERTDVPIKGLVYFGIGLVVFALVIHAALYYLFWGLEDYHAEQDRPLSSVQQERTIPSPPLQGVPGYYSNTPHEDMIELRKKYEQELTQYGPSRVQGHVRVPIERAKEMFLAQQASGAQATEPGR
jgi:hypothetical protein